MGRNCNAPLFVDHLDHQVRAMHPALKVETALEFSGHTEHEEVAEIGIGFNAFEDTDAEPRREFLVGTVQDRINREQAVFSKADCAEAKSSSRRCFEIALRRYIGVRR